MAELRTIGTKLARGDFEIVAYEAGSVLGAVYRVQNIAGQSYRAVFVPKNIATTAEIEKLAQIRHPSTIEIHHRIEASDGTFLVTHKTTEENLPNTPSEADALAKDAISVLAHIHAVGLTGLRFEDPWVLAYHAGKPCIDLAALLLHRNKGGTRTDVEQSDCAALATWALGLDLPFSRRIDRKLHHIAKGEGHIDNALSWHLAELNRRNVQRKRLKWAIPASVAAMGILGILGLQIFTAPPTERPLSEAAAMVLYAPPSDWTIRLPVEIADLPSAAGFKIEPTDSIASFDRLNPWINPNMRVIGLGAEPVSDETDLYDAAKKALGTSDTPPSLLLTVQEVGVPLVEQVALIPLYTRSKKYSEFSIAQRNTAENWQLEIIGADVPELPSNAALLDIPTIEALDAILETAFKHGAEKLQLTLQTPDGKVENTTLPLDYFINPN